VALAPRASRAGDTGSNCALSAFSYVCICPALRIYKVQDEDEVVEEDEEEEGFGRRRRRRRRRRRKVYSKLTQ